MSFPKTWTAEEARRASRLNKSEERWLYNAITIVDGAICDQVADLKNLRNECVVYLTHSPLSNLDKLKSIYEKAGFEVDYLQPNTPSIKMVLSWQLD